MAVKDPTPCPNCGHCPTCGRANAQPYFVPYPWHGYYWVNPYYQPNCSVTSVGSGAGVGTSVYTFAAS